MAQLTKPEVIERFEGYLSSMKMFFKDDVDRDISMWCRKMENLEYLENSAFMWHSDGVMHFYFVNDSDCKMACTLEVDFSNKTCRDLYIKPTKVIIHDPMKAWDRAMKGL